MKDTLRFCRGMRLLVFGSLFFLSGMLVAQEHYVFSVVDAAQGLSDNRIRYLLQLPDGRMVITTDEGLNLYDGTSFSYLHRQDLHRYPLKGYTGYYREYLYGDSLLWIKDYHRLMRVNFRKAAYESRIEQFFHAIGVTDSVCNLFVDKAQNLWLVTRDDRLLFKKPGENKAALFLPEISRVSGREDPLYDLITVKSRVYLFYRSGLMICYDLPTRREVYRRDAFDDEQSRALYSQTSLVVPAPNGFYQLRNGHSNGRFLYFDFSTQSWETILDTDYRLNTLVVGRAGRMVWIAHQHGLLNWDVQTRELTSIPVLRLLDGRKINTELSTLFYDSQGGLWIGTYNRGLLYYHPERFKIRNVGRAFFPGMKDANLQVRSFAEAGTGKIYLWCNETDYFCYNPVSSVLEQCRPSPWIREDLSRVDARPEFRGKKYTSLLRDSRGWIWGGTPDGLKLWKPSLHKEYTLYTSDGLVNNSVQALLEDCDHAVWVSTSNGLSCITVGAEGKLHFSNYDRQDGTIEGEYEVRSAFRAKDGSLYFGGIDGFNQINPRQMAQDTIALTPVFISFYLYGQQVHPGLSYEGNVILDQSAPYTRKIVLNYNQNFFTLCFSGLYYIHPSQTIYRFRLLGVDEDWREQRGSDGLLKAIYTDLRPGTYRFQVYASGNGKRWNGPCTEVEIVVKAPFWATPWAYFLYVLIVVLLLATAVYLYLRYKKRQMDRTHKEEILLMRIKSLLEQCDRYQEQLRQEPENTPGEETSSAPLPKDLPLSVEEEFRQNELLTRAIELIEQNMENNAYSVEQLSRDLCMDRTGLYRKLTALIDKSPTFLIRSVRLKRAAELLAEGNLSVAEIADRVGFSSSAYLSKCFQEEYGMKPSQYAERRKAGN